MTSPRTVLVVSYLPPTGGGIATWAGIVRRHVGETALEFRWLRIPGQRSVAAYARFLARCARELAGDAPDLVHLNFCLSPRGVWRDLPFAALARLRRVPVVVHWHGSVPDVAPQLPALARLAMHRLARVAAMNVAVTHASAALLRRWCGTARVVLLPNFIEDGWLDRGVAPARAGAAPNGRPRAVFVGRLSRDKGSLQLLQAASSLPGVDFDLVGAVAAELRPALAHAPPNVRAWGEMSRAQVLERLADADVFVFPSLREGFPLAVLEAMAVALPVVATAVGSIPEMLENGGGWVVPPGDERALARAVASVTSDRALARRMGERNREACRTRFAFAVVWPQVMAVYETAARKRAQLSAVAPAAAEPSARHP